MTARWLVEPLSVISLASIDNGVARITARATKVELPVAVGSKAVEPVLEQRKHTTVGGQLRQVRMDKVIGDGEAGVDIEDQQSADKVAVEAGQHRVAHIGRETAHNCRPSAAKFTQVPVASLKSSEMRPSNCRPRPRSSGSTNFSASPMQ